METCISASARYMLELGWVLVPVRGPGTPKPKAPIYDGWPECRPAWDDLAALLKDRPNAGIAINLGASGLIDVEADTPEDEARLDDLCADCAFPCWRSLRGKHRLFANDGTIEFLKAGGTEFRTGRHISILPPSLHATGNTRYEWITSPFDIGPPPLPAKLVELYLACMMKEDKQRISNCAPRTATFPFRDDLDYVLRHRRMPEVATRQPVTEAAAAAEVEPEAKAALPPPASSKSLLAFCREHADRCEREALKLDQVIGTADDQKKDGEPRQHTRRVRLAASANQWRAWQAAVDAVVSQDRSVDRQALAGLHNYIASQWRRLRDRRGVGEAALRRWREWARQLDEAFRWLAGDGGAA